MTPDDWRKQLDPNAPPGGPAPGGTQTPGINPGGGGSPFEALGQPGPLNGSPGAPDPGPLMGSPGGATLPPPDQATPLPGTLPSPDTVTPLPGTLPSPPGQPGGPPAPPPDQQGVQQFQAWAQTQFGRQATPQELQQIAQQIGYTGGALTPEMMQQAQAAATALAKGQGWTPPGPGQPGGPPPTGTGAPDPNTLLEQRIRQMLEQNPNDIDPNNPAMAAQRDSFRRGNQRATEQAKRQMAQRAAGGFTGGAQDAGMLGVDLEAAGREGDFESGLMQRELQTQRDQTMQAMQMAQQAGLTREAQQLQEKLATQDLALRRMLGMGQLGLGAAQLGQQGRHFDANLGFNYWRELQNAQRGELLNILGGL